MSSAAPMQPQSPKIWAILERSEMWVAMVQPPDSEIEFHTCTKKKTPENPKIFRGLLGAGVGFEPTTFRL